MKTQKHYYLAGFVKAAAAKLRSAVSSTEADKAAEDLASMLQKGYPAPEGETRSALWAEYLGHAKKKVKL